MQRKRENYIYLRSIHCIKMAEEWMYFMAQFIIYDFDYSLNFRFTVQVRTSVINYSFQACIDEHGNWISIIEKHPMKNERSTILSGSRAQNLFSGRISWNDQSFGNESLLCTIGRNSKWPQSIGVPSLPLCYQYCLEGICSY